MLILITISRSSQFPTFSKQMFKGSDHMLCPKCHFDNPSAAVFCCQCGRRLAPSARKPKRTGNGTGTAYKHHGSWYAQVIVGYRPLPPLADATEEQNHRQRVPIKLTKGGFKTRAEALAYCPILKAGGVVKQIQAPTLSHYWETYQIGAYKNLSKSKQAAYRIAWNRLKSLHDAHMDALTVHLVCQVVDDTCSTYYPARDCKSLLTTLFNLAAADGYCNKDIPSFITLPKLEETERTPFSDTEQAALWKLYESGDLRAAIPLLMIYTGMMPGEAMKLRAEHIHLDTRQIIGAGLKTAVRRKSPIVLADNILPLVQDLLDNAQPSGFIWKQAEHDWYADYYAALQAAGCRRLTPYSCRHTTATVLAISEGIAPQTVKKVMRWSTSKMLDRYAHPDHADAIDAVNTIQKKAT